MKDFFIRYWHILLLLAVISAVVITNFTPHTFLTGWDNLHPEFNFWLNIKRSLFSVWEEYQGTGLLAGMAHASDLPRQLILLVASLVVPQSLIRYLFHFSMLFVGCLGTYVLLTRLFLSDAKESVKRSAGTLGGLFYLLNLGTVQNFFVPFEPYSMFWGMLPWEIYVFFRYLERPTRSRLLTLAAVNLIAVPQAYVQTVFLVYVLLLGLFSIVHLIKNRRAALRPLSAVFAVIFIVNAFWLLPNLYFTFHDVKVTETAMNNMMNTEKFFEQNMARGTIANFAMLKGFYYDLLGSSGQGSNTYAYMMQPWRSYNALPFISFLGFAFFGIVLVGLLRRHPYRASLAAALGLIAIAWLSDTIGFAGVNALLRSLPLVNQIFRNPFTKFVEPASLLFAILFGLGCAYLLSCLGRLRLRHVLQPVATLLVALLLIIYALPAFQGYFLSPTVRNTIPQEYFQLFAYMQTQSPNARIMDLPQGSYWGWGTYSWGTTGSGFLWYGIEQPIMDRTFDVWSTQLENYYWQLWYALKNKDQALFDQVIEKYQIRYILYDSSFTPSDSNPFKTLFLEQDMLQGNPKVKLVKRFGPDLWLYKTHLNTTYHQNITIEKNLPSAGPTEPYSHIDEPFRLLGPYTSAPARSADYLFPFSSLFTSRFPSEVPFRITTGASGAVFTNTIPAGRYTLFLPSLADTEHYLPVTFATRVSDNTLTIRLNLTRPVLRLNNQPVPVPSHTTDVTIPLSGSQAAGTFLLNINSKDTFVIHPTRNFEDIGTTLLYNVNGGNTIKLYSSVGSQTVGMPTNRFQGSLSCTPGAKGDVSSSSNSQALTIHATGISACNAYTGSVAPVMHAQEVLAKTSFTYVSQNDEHPSYCLSTTDTSCINTKDRIPPPTSFSRTPHKFTDYVIVPDVSQVSGFQLSLPIELSQDGTQAKQITYEKPSLTYYPLLTTIDDTSVLPYIRDNVSQVTVTLPKPTQVSIAIPKMQNAYTFPDLIGQDMYKQAVTIPDNLPVSGNAYYKEYGDSHGKEVRVYAQNTYSQFWIKLDGTIADYGYLLTTQTKNVQGLPFVLNVFTPTGDNNKYLYTMLPASHNWTTTQYVLPPLYAFDPGMQLLFMGSSFNRHPDINDIHDLSLMPLPYAFLGSLYLRNDSKVQTVVPAGNQQTGSVSALKHTYFSYTALIPKDSEASTLVLSQAYHAGWNAYAVSNTSWLETYLPFIFGKKITHHIVVNGWENGWEIPPHRQDMTVSLLFLPQYLEFAGFILLIALLGYSIWVFRPWRRLRRGRDLTTDVVL